MKQATRFTVDPGWALMMRDMGVNIQDVLRMAGLPESLFENLEGSLTVADYFSIWVGLEKVAGQDMPLRLSKVMSAEAFSPPIFASLCSQNLNMALGRLQQFKRLIGPLFIDLDINASQTSITFDLYQYNGLTPDLLMASELVFMTELVRMATRQNVKPLEVYWPKEYEGIEKYEEYFGTRPRLGDCTRLVFSAEDANRPFMTQNPAMWTYFEPQLQKRLQAQDSQASFSEKVKNVLLEMLPAGLSAIEEAANRLAVSKRTLQRRLTEEATNYQSVLNKTREQLATHYLKNSKMSSAEISFLLGFQDTNSFFRAFNNWTGSTPEKVRALQ